MPSNPLTAASKEEPSAPVDISDYYEKFGVTEAGEIYVEEVRRSPPSRKVRGRKSNMVVRFSSKKMGRTIQCESRSVEYLFALYFEFSGEIIEFWDQPTPLKLKYKSSTGKQIGNRHHPDFLVISENYFGFIECKDDAELPKLCLKHPGRYERNSLRLPCTRL